MRCAKKRAGEAGPTIAAIVDGAYELTAVIRSRINVGGLEKPYRNVRVGRSPGGRDAKIGVNYGGERSAASGSGLAGTVGGTEYAMSPIELHAIVRRVRAEFLEMPGLRLTLPQASRLWGLETPACEAVIEALIQSAFLHRTATGAVTRAEG